jgi:uncharacterized membrane protein
LAAGSFFAALMGWMRFILSLQNWDFFQTLGVSPGTWYLVANGLVTAMVYTVAGILVLIPHEKWNKPVTILLLFGLASYWIDRIFFARSMEAQIALPFSLILSAGLTLLAICLLHWKTLGSRLKNWKN